MTVRAGVALTAVVAALAAPAAARGATFTVAAGDGGCGGADTACGSIAAAAGAAGSGDAVHIRSGSYTESATFAKAGVKVTGSTVAPGVVVSGTLRFAGSGAPSVLERVVVAAPEGGAPAVAVSGEAGLALRDALLIGSGASGLAITGGAGNEITRSTILASAAAGTAVDVRLGANGANLNMNSSVLSGGGGGVGLAVTTGVDTLLPGTAGGANVVARHVTIAGAATGIALDASAATGILTLPAGRIAVAASDSIVHGANPTRINPGLPPLLAPNTATVTLTRTDQTTDPGALFISPSKRNYHLRADAPVIDKGQLTDGDSATDLDGQPRTAGAASDLGADEFVNTPPTAAIAVKTVNPRDRQPVTLDGAASSDREAAFGGQIVEYRWSFGDGRSQTTATPTVEHTYESKGTVVAQLVVVDRQGAVSSVATTPVQIGDGTAPTVVISKPKARTKVALRTRKGRKARVTFAGSARDVSGVKSVVLVIQKLNALSKKTCTFLDKTKGLVKRDCDEPVYIRASLKRANWTYTVASKIELRRGSYRISAFATDGGGAFGNAAVPSRRTGRFTLT